MLSLEEQKEIKDYLENFSNPSTDNMFCSTTDLFDSPSYNKEEQNK